MHLLQPKVIAIRAVKPEQETRKMKTMSQLRTETILKLEPEPGPETVIDCQNLEPES